jgi:hypothetical protein
MNIITKLIATGLVLIACSFSAGGEELVLQNGLNGYSGCVDAHISTGQDQGLVNSNFGNGQTIICGYHHRL